MILSRSPLYPPLLHLRYNGGARSGRDETCDLTKRASECAMWTWTWANDHQQNENEWVVIPQEEIFPHLFLDVKSASCLTMAECVGFTQIALYWSFWEPSCQHLLQLPFFSVSMYLLWNKWAKGVVVTKRIGRKDWRECVGVWWWCLAMLLNQLLMAIMSMEVQSSADSGGVLIVRQRTWLTWRRGTGQHGFPHLY